MTRVTIFRVLSVLLAMFTAAAAARADVVVDWNGTLRAVIQSEGTQPNNHANPGWATRAIAMTNGAIYDAFQAVNRTHTPFLVDTQAAAGTSLDAAVHQAAYEILLDCYATEQTLLDAAYNSRMGSVAEGAAKTNGISLGHSIAQAYLANRLGDGSSGSVPYTPGTNPGEWRPDPYNPGQQAWGPGWGTVSTFAIPNTAGFISTLPAVPALSSQEYADAFDMVKQYGALNSAFRTQDQTEMGLFWAYDRATMGPPPVLFVRNLEEIATQAGNTAEENARLFAMTSLAMADAAITAWDAKFTYNFWRPVTAIQEADFDGNAATLADANWKPLGAPGNNPGSDLDDFTPPFPAWTSGHATMGGALYKSLELFYGTNQFDEIDGILGNNAVYQLTSEEAGSGTTRSFTTFTQVGPLGIGMENSPEGENGMSRIYLGIHWIFDQQDGITLGNDIAAYVHSNMFQPVPEPGTLALLLFGAAILPVWGLRRRKAPKATLP